MSETRSQTCSNESKKIAASKSIVKFVFRNGELSLLIARRSFLQMEHVSWVHSLRAKNSCSEFAATLCLAKLGPGKSDWLDYLCSL